MANHLVFTALALYILLLVLFTKLVKSKGDNNAFFRAGRKSPWLLVAFGMIGASISGVSLVSVPGWVRTSGMTYFQMCLGFLAGYFVIAALLLPLYYRLRLTSIYSYLAQRFGRRSHLTGASFFLLSKLTGAAARLYVTCIVLHEMAIRPLGLPFWLTIAVVLTAIFLYTRRGGIENIVRTDALQTFCLLAATVCIAWVVSAKLNLSLSGIADAVSRSPMGRIFCWDASSTRFFFRQFINGMFITIVMNGLDQDMMQKNLTCTSLRNAQKNMCLYGVCILPVNLLFLVIGVLLYTFAEQEGIAIPDAGDRLLPMLVGSGALGAIVVFPFTIGITAAALSSADSAMTSLTTSICVDILRVERDDFDQKRALLWRHRVHATVALAFALCIAIFHIAGSGTIIDTIYRLAGYTYGPLLGLFCFGLFTRRQVIDKAVPYIAVVSPILCALLDYLAPVMWGYHFSYELLLLNAVLTFLALYCASRPTINPALQQYIKKNILPRYNAFDKAHQQEHARMVIRQSLELAAHLDVDINMVYAIAAYHDTGLCEGREHHHEVSAQIIQEDQNLRKWFTEEQISVIAYAAEDHRASSDHEPRTIYGRIVAEADRYIEPLDIIKRTIQYGLDHYPELSREEHFERMVAHLQEKYGRSGYLKLWFTDSPNARRLEELRSMIDNEARLRQAFDDFWAKRM